MNQDDDGKRIDAMDAHRGDSCNPLAMLIEAGHRHAGAAAPGLWDCFIRGLGAVPEWPCLMNWEPPRRGT